MCFFPAQCAFHPAQQSCYTCKWDLTPSGKGSFLHPLGSTALTSPAGDGVFPVLQKIITELERLLPHRFALLAVQGFCARKQHRGLEVVLHLWCLREAGRDPRGFRHE